MAEERRSEQRPEEMKVAVTKKKKVAVTGKHSR